MARRLFGGGTQASKIRNEILIVTVSARGFEIDGEVFSSEEELCKAVRENGPTSVEVHPDRLAQPEKIKRAVQAMEGTGVLVEIVLPKFAAEPIDRLPMPSKN